MDADLLCRIGEAMYGTPTFRPRLAEDLGWDVRKVQRWCAGSEEVPSHIRSRLRELLRGRYREFTDLIAELGESE